MGSIPVRVTKKEAVTLKRDRFFLRSLPASGTVPRVAYERTRAGERPPRASGRRDVSVFPAGANSTCAIKHYPNKTYPPWCRIAQQTGAITRKRNCFCLFLHKQTSAGKCMLRTRAGERLPRASGRRDVSDSLSAKVSGAKYYEPNTSIIT